jgi:hypothetical protein
MSFAGLMNDVITVETFTSQDGYGQPIFGSSRQLPARIQAGPKKTINSRGEEIVSGVRIYIAGSSISIKDRITLPARFSPQQPPILRIETPNGLHSIHHTVIYA